MPTYEYECRQCRKSFTEKLAESFGGELAEGVQRALSKPGTPISGPIESEYVIIDLPLQEKGE